MDGAILQAVGGLGVFLIGIHLLTEGLRSVAGNRMRDYISRAAGTPARGALTGAVVTAVVQSSSATTVAAVGLAGAGVLAFEQSLGIIFGANVGTTLTGWLVAVVGFKVELGSLSGVIVLCGALLRLIGHRPLVKSTGAAIAGFGLVFLGIDFLKVGMSGLSEHLVLPEGLGVTFGGKLLALGMGVVLSLVTQSSSATIAATLTALSGGVIELPAALAVAIGADIGTTGTAVLATAGGTVASRRTGWAHVIYNCLTGVLAFAILPLYLLLIRSVSPALETSDPETLTVLFHTSFNVVGTLLALPLTKPFGNLIRRIVPGGDGPSLTSDLDPALLADPRAGLEGATRSTRLIGAMSLDALGSATSDEASDLVDAKCRRVLGAVVLARDYLSRIFASGLPPSVSSSALALLHVLDHSERLAERCLDTDESRVARDSDFFADDLRSLRLALDTTTDSCDEATPLSLSEVGSLRLIAKDLETNYRSRRREIVSLSVAGKLGAQATDDLLDSLRWLERCTWHAWRIRRYLKRA